MRRRILHSFGKRFFQTMFFVLKVDNMKSSLNISMIFLTASIYFIAHVLFFYSQLVKLSLYEILVCS